MAGSAPTKPNRTRRNRSAGAANEAGSLYRSGVGAYLIAHGLTGVTIGFLPEELAGVPVQLVVEADDEVDDIVCEMSDGRKLLLQAKRTVGLNATLRKAVDQWVRQIRAGLDPTRATLVVVASELSAPAKALQRALERERNRAPQKGSKAEAQALKWLKDYVEIQLSVPEFDILKNAAHLIELPTEDRTHSLYREAARLIEGLVIPVDTGTAVLDALSNSIRTTAARRHASSIKDWLTTIRSTRIPLLHSPDLTPAAEQIELEAGLDQYSIYLAREQDKLNLSILFQDVPPLDVPDLIETYNVMAERTGNSEHKNSEFSLSDIVKRWGRVALVGLPGSGKSTAARQLATSWLAEEDAPFPVIVPLRSVASKCADKAGRLSLTELAHLACRHVNSSRISKVEQELVRRLRAGTAGLILDGLDECGSETGHVVDTIADAIDAIDSRSPIVLTTRSSMTPALRRLSISKIELIEPKALHDNMTQLITHIGKSRIPIDQQQAWIYERISWMKQSCTTDPELWRVPLLATLTTALICDRYGSIPRSRLEALSGAVTASVRDWEARRGVHPEHYRWAVQIDIPTLMSAFETIGHLIMNGVVRVADVVARFEVELDHGGASASKATQNEIARGLIRFWDEIAGVFLVDEATGTLTPRTQSFAELGDAAYASSRLDADSRVKWIGDRLGTSKHESVRLACQYQPELFGEIVKIAEKSPRESTLKLCIAISKGLPSPQPQALGLLFDVLLGAYHGNIEAPAQPAGIDIFWSIDDTQDRQDGAAWKWMVALTQLHLPAEIRARRVQAIESIEDDEKRHIARALDTISCIDHEGRPVSTTDIELFRAVIDLPMPLDAEDRTRNKRAGRRVYSLSGTPLTSGRVSALAGIARLYPKLSVADARKIDDVAYRGPSRDFEKVRFALIERGLTTQLRDVYSVLRGFDFDQFNDRLREEWEDYLSVIEKTTPEFSSTDLHPNERWSLRRLADLTEEVGARSSRAWSLHVAIKVGQDFLAVLQLIIDALGLEPPLVGAEASVAKSMLENDYRDVIGYLFIPPPPTTKWQADYSALDDAQQELLARFILRGPSLLAQLAWKILANANCTEVLNHFPDDLSIIPAANRAYAVKFYLRMSSEQAATAQDLLEYEDPLVRQSAAYVLTYTSITTDISTVNTTLPAEISALLNDNDLTVREAVQTCLERVHNIKVDINDSPASFWSCKDCGNANSIDAGDCAHCAPDQSPS